MPCRLQLSLPSHPSSLSHLLAHLTPVLGSGPVPSQTIVGRAGLCIFASSSLPRSSPCGCCSAMDQVRPLYSHVQSVVLDSLRREWQRYGWEDSEIDEKVEKLSQLWNAALTATGALPEPSASLLKIEKEEEEGKEGEAGAKKEEGEAGERKRKRKAADEAGEKRFKSGPRTPMAPAPSIPPYIHRTAFPALPTSTLPRPVPPPTAPPPPISSPLAPLLSRIPQIDGSPDHPPSPSSSSAPSGVPPLSVPSSSGGLSNPLLSEPLSVLDDPDSGDELELKSVVDLMLCQYERVSHVKGRWRVVLRDGIMHIKGKDYVFSKATGELQW